MDWPTSAAIMLGLKVVGPPSMTVVQTFLNQVLTPPGKALGNALAAPVEEWRRERAKRQEALIKAAAEKVDAEGKIPHAIPNRLLVPILEKGSLEENDILRDLWTELLARAAVAKDESAVTPAFIDILAGLSPQEAQILSYLGKRDRSRASMYIHLLAIEHDLKIPIGVLRMYADNMVRLGIWQLPASELDGRQLARWVDERVTHLLEDYKRNEGSGLPSTSRRVYGNMHTAMGMMFPKDLSLNTDEQRFEFSILGRAFICVCVQEPDEL